MSDANTSQEINGACCRIAAVALRFQVALEIVLDAAGIATHLVKFMRIGRKKMLTGIPFDTFPLRS